MLRGGGSALPPDLSGSTPGERNFSFCLLLAPALSSDTPSRSLCLIRNTWGHFDWPTFCQVSRSLSQQWPCFCCGRWKCQHSTRGPSLSQGRGAAGDPHSDSHDLFGECFLLTRNFVVLVEPLRGGCWGTLVWVTWPLRQQWRSRVWCLGLCHRERRRRGCLLPSFGFAAGLGKSSHPPVDTAPGSTPAVRAGRHLGVLPRCGKVPGRRRTSECVLFCF